MAFLYFLAFLGFVGVSGINGNNTVAVSDPRLHWFGRKLLTASSAQFSWIGVGFSLRLAPDSSPGNVSVEIDGYGARFAVYNGQKQTMDFIAPERGVYTLATAAMPGDLITVIKTTERNAVEFFSLQLSTGVKIAPFGAPPSRRIEFWGDSGTSAYGVDSDSSWTEEVGCGWDLEKYENFAHGWVQNVIHALGAEAHTQAIAGIGVAKNCFSGLCSGTWETMPELVGRTIHTIAKDDYDASLWQPDLVVVKIGANDFTMNLFDPTADQFKVAYSAMVKNIIKSYGSVPVLHLCNVVESPNTQCEYIKAVAAANGQQYSTTLDADAENAACAGHRTAPQQAALATRLIPVIARAAGWGIASDTEFLI